MKRFVIALLSILLLSTGTSYAASKSTQPSPLKQGIMMYKAGNYTGCVQHMEKIVEQDPGNALAHYYLAMAYARIGNKEGALKGYNSVISLNTSPQLTNYAKMGIICTETPDKCSDPNNNIGNNINKVKQEIKATVVAPLSNTVDANIKEKKLESIKNIINSGSEVPKNNINEFEDFSKPKHKSENTAPSNDDIANALKVLAQAGINPLNSYNPYSNPEALQMNMLLGSMGGGFSGLTGGNNMMNLLPLLMMQQQSNGKSNIDPRVIETMFMSSMTPSLFSSDRDRY